MDYLLLGKNVRKYRLQMGMKQEGLAEAIGCSGGYIGQIEHAKNTPSLETVVNLANALNVTVDQLILDSLDYPELVFLRDIEKRIKDMPVSLKIKACEMLDDLVTIIERAKK